jgi:S-adenosylmethionine:tRNA ribosyltransferase-isomerase
MKLSKFDYRLPSSLIAQSPAPERSKSRMMIVHRENGTIEHKTFKEITDYISSDDLVVLNNTRVFPARLFGTKINGSAKIEVLLTKEIEENLWECMIKPARRVKIGDKIRFNDWLQGIIKGKNQRGRRYIHFEPLGNDLMNIVEEIGRTPLPPYIKREVDSPEDRKRYQTIFARKSGSIAAPTAGLHIDEEMLGKIRKKCLNLCEITLTVGPGTFIPVNTETIEEFKVEHEAYEITRSAARKIEHALVGENPIIAIGTTVVRALESNYLHRASGRFSHGKRTTELFIYPGFEFNVVSKLLTNFHLPKSSLLMLVSAFAGYDLIMNAYRTAIKEKYRFYSYGDCMFII